MTRLHLIHSPDPDRDLPDPGDEIEADPTCRTCGGPLEESRHKDCDRCHWGPDEDSDDTADEDHRAVHEHD